LFSSSPSTPTMTFEIAFDSTPYNPTITRVVPVVLALSFHAAVQYKEPFAHHFVVGLATTWAILTHVIHDAWKVDYCEATSTVAGMFAIFVATIWTSMTLYRVFKHPLRQVPGPLSSKISMWTWVPADWMGKRAKTMQTLHQKFGDEVRVGPREISCVDPAALMTIYGPSGPSAKATRGPWYTGESLLLEIVIRMTHKRLPSQRRA
jgi:hypothetical protein